MLFACIHIFGKREANYRLRLCFMKQIVCCCCCSIAYCRYHMLHIYENTAGCNTLERCLLCMNFTSCNFERGQCQYFVPKNQIMKVCLLCYVCTQQCTLVRYSAAMQNLRASQSVGPDSDHLRLHTKWETTISLDYCDSVPQSIDTISIWVIVTGIIQISEEGWLLDIHQKYSHVPWWLVIVAN